MRCSCRRCSKRRRRRRWRSGWVRGRCRSRASARLAAVGNAMDAELSGADRVHGGDGAPSLGRAAEVSASKMRYQMNRLRRMAATFRGAEGSVVAEARGGDGIERVSGWASAGTVGGGGVVSGAVRRRVAAVAGGARRAGVPGAPGYPVIGSTPNHARINRVFRYHKKNTDNTAS